MGLFDQFRLDGKTALVTGGSRGIGLGITRRLLVSFGWPRNVGAHALKGATVGVGFDVGIPAVQLQSRAEWSSADTMQKWYTRWRRREDPLPQMLEVSLEPDDAASTASSHSFDYSSEDLLDEELPSPAPPVALPLPVHSRRKRPRPPSDSSTGNDDDADSAPPVITRRSSSSPPALSRPRFRLMHQ